MNIKARIEKLETSGDEWIFVRKCNACGQMVVWGDIACLPPDEIDCTRHRLAPPPAPGDIVIQWAGLDRQ